MIEIDDMFFDLRKVIIIGKIRYPQGGEAWYPVYFKGKGSIEFLHEKRENSYMPYCPREELVYKVKKAKEEVKSR